MKESSYLKKLKQILRFRRISEIQLLKQKYVDLFTTYEKIKLNEAKSKNFTKITSKIDDLFSSRKDWDKANEIEQYLVAMFDEAELDVEFKVKLLDAKRKLGEDTWKFYEAEFQTQNGKGKQSLLSSLYKDLQWAYDVEQTGKEYITQTRIRTSLLFIASIFMFFMIDQVSQIAALLKIEPGDKGDLIVTAMAAGWMGTSFSMLIGLKNRIQISSISDLKVIHRFDYIFSRALIGMISSLILFYTFQSEILTGTFFPVFDPLNPQHPLDEKNTALLVIWSFISGFSEKLVPDLLIKTEQKVSQE